MKKYRSPFRALFEFSFGSPIKAQYELVRHAMRVKAQRVSDCEYHRVMANFYTDRSLSIDPHKEWWDFADAKQGQQDHQREVVLLEERLAKADAALRSQTVKLESLLQKAAFPLASDSTNNGIDNQ